MLLVTILDYTKLFLLIKKTHERKNPLQLCYYGLNVTTQNYLSYKPVCKTVPNNIYVYVGSVCTCVSTDLQKLSQFLTYTMRFLGSNLGQLAWWQAYLPANILHSVTSHQPRQTWVIKQVREGQYVSSKALSIKTMKFLLGDLGVPTHSRATEAL